RVNQFQRDLSENAQAIESAYQEALSTVQKKHLDPIIEGIIAKKKLDLVIDGRMARTGTNTNGLDITDEVVKALNKKISSVKMSTPKGL
ncbi:MAG: OmpH family outer membrane protein, partial [Alphaproteobacteria bacterium]|nr:OmpH family outer membrane protein [Alphaproteobacteria bacterium]